MKFKKINKEAFDSFQMEAGVLLKTFDPVSPKVQDQDIICATTGGVNAMCVPTYKDHGEDVDNCPANLKELKQLVSWLCTLGFTALSISPESLKLSLAAADIDPESGKVTPRQDLKAEDFGDLWWVGDRLDGGMVAVCLKNALSTGGLSIQTSKNGKGQLAVTLTGHPTSTALDTVPMEFYSAAPAA